MPITDTTIEKVWTEWRNTGPSRAPKFVIVAPNFLRFETWNALQASLCERAAEQGFSVRITWKDGRWCKDLVAVERATVEAA